MWAPLNVLEVNTVSERSHESTNRFGHLVSLGGVAWPCRARVTATQLGWGSRPGGHRHLSPAPNNGGAGSLVQSLLAFCIQTISDPHRLRPPLYSKIPRWARPLSIKTNRAFDPAIPTNTCFTPTRDHVS